MKGATTTSRTRCRGCVHYYVTWDPRAPHGCRAMGFKSRRLPIAVVRRATADADCLAFEPAPGHAPPTDKAKYSRWQTR